MIKGYTKNTGSRASAMQIAPVGATSWHYYAILAVLGIFLGFFVKEAYLGMALHPIQVFIASITTSLLSILDIQVIQQGTVLVHSSGFACEITPGCTGLVPVVMYLVAVLMYPARSSHKAIGLLAGILFLVGFNFIRLVNLVYVGSHHPSWFEFAHLVAWQTLIALTVVAAWWIWTAWSRRQTCHGL